MVFYSLSGVRLMAIPARSFLSIPFLFEATVLVEATVGWLGSFSPIT